ncbi:MAG: DUF1553 domain-containing protein [Acidobacteriota bacterium]|nr:DUF1553 domain-containing protein [Acidobacteriota bacterium]
MLLLRPLYPSLAKILAIFLICLGWDPGLAHGQETAVPPTLLSLRIVPEDIHLSGLSPSQQLVLLGRYSDGLERDLTGASSLELGSTEVATIEDQGRLTALSEGSTTLHAHVANHSASAMLTVQSLATPPPFSFQHDIGGILTKRGCNDSSCHAGVKGRGGFKLSLNALDPKEDYRWIVNGGTYQVMSLESAGPESPRIDLSQPENSLLLRKPTLLLPHGGGERLTTKSSDYRTLLDWIQSGAPYERKDSEVEVEQVTLFPEERVLDAEGTHQLLVTAHLADGRTRDLTQQASYQSTNEEVVTVTDSGRVQARSTGETTIIVRTAGHTASARFGVISEPLQTNPSPPPHNFIDDHVFGKLSRFQIPASPLSSDAEFLRRVCLDLTGTLPPPDRAREFIASRDPQKRTKLIDALLDSPEYVDYWTFRFGRLFRVAAGAVGGAEHAYTYWRWVWRNIAQNTSYREIALERLAAQGYGGASRHFLSYGEEAKAADIMPEEVRVFLGRRLDCAQCHDHPYEQWSQDQFWGLASFFGQISRTEWTGFGASVLFDDPAGRQPDFGESAETVKVIHPRRKQLVKPAFLDGQAIASAGNGHPRREFARWITTHPYFAETLVNRMWGHLFGRGLVDPVDDFRSTNPPTHPGLLQALAEDCRLHEYDLKQILRRITRSRTYQLASTPLESNREDALNYSHFIPKPLEAEVLLDAISQVTGVPEVFESGPGGQAPLGTRAIQLEVPDIYPSDFLQMYGRPNLLQIPEVKASPSLNQALHMLVGKTYTEKISRKGGRLDQLIQRDASHREVIQELYLAALSRLPSPLELSELESVLGKSSDKRQAWEDLVWSLITSREFAFNH